MKFSGLIFPFPSPPTYSHDHLVGELLYVPKDFNDSPYKYMDSSRLDAKIDAMSFGGLLSPNNLDARSGRILTEIDSNYDSVAPS